MIYDELRPKFWENYPLDALTDAEWEALCDGCGACCLVKFLDDDNVKFTEYTDVACQLLDCSTGFCQNYAKRQTIVPDCIRLTPDMLPDMLWLPRHCAYKRLYLGQNLPAWHRLIKNSQNHGVGFSKVSTAERCVSELGMSDEDIERRVVKWVKP